MQQTGRARPVPDLGMYAFRRKLEYEGEPYGTKIVVADRHRASTKTCSACGATNEALRLAHRSWTCPACGTRQDRDGNAAANLREMAAASCVATTPDEGANIAPMKRDLVRRKPSFSA